MKKLLFLLFTLASINIYSQETVGLTFFNGNSDISDGYTLFNPLSDNRTFLINNCGEVVNTWTFSGFNSRNSYLLENGTILHSYEQGADIRDWNDNILWSINYLDLFGFETHHDIEPLPNGNYLALVRDPYTNIEMFEEGLDTSYDAQALVLQRIIEIQPVGTDSANIVWEWKIFDHLVQDFDSSKDNFGSIANNPQLLDVNYEEGDGSNRIHANAIDYNAELDQIAVSSRSLSEVFIIDHSTTTAEAASHSGGRYGQGGDLLWRWGNPQVYDQGDESDRTLGRQHDIKWIEEGKDKGKLSVFSNRAYAEDSNASSIHILDPNETNGFYAFDGANFFPEDYYWSWDGMILNDIFHAPLMSGVQILPNNNALINESNSGRISEVDEDGNIVWVYVIPVALNGEIEQFSEPSANGSFRAHRYPPSFKGFEGLDLTPSGIIENINDNSEICSSLLSTEEDFYVDLDYYPNPVDNILTFEFTKDLDKITVIDVLGNTVKEINNSNFLDMGSLPSGLYILKILSGQNDKLIKIIKR